MYINSVGRESRSKLSHILITIPQGTEDGTVSALYKKSKGNNDYIAH